ncbi:MAG: ribosome silencing factor [Bacteroidia bacterium]|nr:ribosome silencing factor [Bacteroidia bacterium]
MTNNKAEAIKPHDTEQLIDLIIDSISDIKGQNIVKIDLRQIDDAPTEYFIICEGSSNTQVNAIAERIRERTKKEANNPPAHVEGNKSNTWVLLDYFDTVVHVFYRETRAFYDLEDLWSDGIMTEYDRL